MFIKDLLNELTYTQMNVGGTAITANGTSTGVATTGMVGEAVISIDLPEATAGTTPTLSVAVQTSTTSGGTYVALNNAAGNAIVFTSATGSVSVFQQLLIDTRLSQGYVRLAWTIGGTSSPSFPSLSATLVSSAQVH